MLASWTDKCHPFYTFGFCPTNRTKEKEDDVEMVYAEVIDGNLKLEDYWTACDNLINAITGEGK
jgi:hypothetical protein